MTRIDRTDPKVSFAHRLATHRSASIRVVQIWLLILAMTWRTPASVEVDAVLKLEPVGTESYVAATLELDQGQGLSGLHFYNNDALATFPRLILMEGVEGSPPDLANSALIILEIWGESLSWGEVTLPQTVGSSSGIIHFVFQLPANSTVTARGDGGGAALGVGPTGTGLPFYISPEGEEWIAFDPDYELAVEPVLTSAKGAPVTLASILESGGQEAKDGATPVKATLLHDPYPNPFNPEVTIRFDLKQPAKVSMEIYDVRGRRVKSLLGDRWPAGRHRVLWRGRDHHGQSVASGVYFLTMQSSDGHAFRKRLVLLK